MDLNPLNDFYCVAGGGICSCNKNAQNSKEYGLSGRGSSPVSYILI